MATYRVLYEDYNGAGRFMTVSASSPEHAVWKASSQLEGNDATFVGVQKIER
jgi:hypothetical protein